jgi:phage repressor protein C with HTH and peptisase S24 domain
MTEHNIAVFLKQLRKTSGCSANEIVDKLKDFNIDISAKTLYGYESGISMLNADTFVALCKIYKCDNPMDIFNTPSLNADEVSIIEQYRSLDLIGKELVNHTLKVESSRAEALNNLNKQLSEQSATLIDFETISPHYVPYYRKCVSAGPGEWVFDDMVEDQLPVDEETALKADFAVQISGNSMEPEYHDGDIVLISAQGEIETGEIGIFMLNGKSYIKKAGKDGLISLNPAYDLIPVKEDDSFQCIGKVIGKLKVK